MASPAVSLHKNIDKKSPSKKVRSPLLATEMNEQHTRHGPQQQRPHRQSLEKLKIAPHSPSPLKRSDGILNLEQAFLGSPVAKSTPTAAPCTKRALQKPSYARNRPGRPLEFANNLGPESPSLLKRTVSMENVGPSARESPFGSAGPVVNPSMHPHHPLARMKASSSPDTGYATPRSFKLVKPLQTAFMSTGLISKRNRNPAADTSGPPPETPCKRHAPIPVGTPGSGEHEVSFAFSSCNEDYDLPPTPTKGVLVSVPKSKRMLGEISPSFGQNYLAELDASRLSISSMPPPGMVTGAEPPVTPTVEVPTSYTYSQSQSGATPLGSSAETPHHIKRTTSGLSTLLKRFSSANAIGSGEFSEVFETVDTRGDKFAVKRTRCAYGGQKSRTRRLEEVEILRRLKGHDHIVELVESFEDEGHLYIQTEFCENGSLDVFLSEHGRQGRVEEFRCWKMLLEISLGLQHIHEIGYIHLDLKPANILITFEGTLKIGDFGMATSWPSMSGSTEREGDREYIAPEVLTKQTYSPAADVFSLGLIMLEIAANVVLPDNGLPWQKLRSGDLSDASVELGDGMETHVAKIEDPADDCPLQKGVMEGFVRWLLSPEASERPTASDILTSVPLAWVDSRRSAGAVVYEGEYGPTMATGVAHTGPGQILPNLEEEGDWRMEM